MSDGLSETDVELFGSLFVFMQQLAQRVDEWLESFGLTSRQWLLLGVLEKAFPGYAPTLSETAAVFGTSRQNVKQVALQLERRGWLRLERDPTDARALRLVLTDRVAVFHDPVVRDEQAAFILDVFDDLSRRERRAFLDMVTRCSTRLSSPPSEGGAPPKKRSVP
jgi:DNA-binding MarR family transcriptional regulator